MSQTFWATRVVNGIKQRKEFGRIQWDMIKGKDGNHDGWIAEGENATQQTQDEVKKPFVPSEIASRDKNISAAEKDALNELDSAINGDKKTEAVESAPDELKKDEKKEKAESLKKVNADSAKKFQDNKKKGK